MSGLTAVDVIIAKRDGRELGGEQIRWIIDAYTQGEVAEEQMSALLMAILLNGMTGAEIANWTTAMISSGIRLDLSGVGRPTVDKHSTGGVGDKISLPLAPLVAACGAAVPQLSGRGLGHTGGTLDKMESIRGWRATLTPEQMIDQLASVGAVICAASADLAPADRKLYALRDVTGTVESIPMIACVHHEQEDRRRNRVAGARCEGRHRGIHEAGGPRRRTGQDDGGTRCPRGCSDLGVADRHVHAARRRRRQRRGGRRIARGTRRWRPRRRGRTDDRSCPRDGLARRVGCRPCASARLGQGDGQLAAARRTPRAGTRMRRWRCRGTARSCSPKPMEWSRLSMHWVSGWRHGGSAPVVRAGSTTCRRRRASCAGRAR